jgi:hypothetical protein
VHALRNIHAALAPDGIIVDTQPVSARPTVTSEAAKLGTLDMRDWIATIHAVDELVAQTIAGGLYELRHESRFVVTDTYDNGPEVLGHRERLARHECPARSFAATRGRHAIRDGAAAGTATATAARDVNSTHIPSAGCEAAFAPPRPAAEARLRAGNRPNDPTYVRVFAWLRIVAIYFVSTFRLPSGCGFSGSI